MSENIMVLKTSHLCAIIAGQIVRLYRLSDHLDYHDSLIDVFSLGSEIFNEIWNGRIYLSAIALFLWVFVAHTLIKIN